MLEVQPTLAHISEMICFNKAQQNASINKLCESPNLHRYVSSESTTWGALMFFHIDTLDFWSQRLLSRKLSCHCRSWLSCLHLHISIDKHTFSIQILNFLAQLEGQVDNLFTAVMSCFKDRGLVRTGPQKHRTDRYASMLKTASFPPLTHTIKLLCHIVHLFVNVCKHTCGSRPSSPF